MEDWMYEAYQNAKMTVYAFERMMDLERENEELREKLKEHEDRVDRMFRSANESIGKTFSALLNK